MAEEDENLDRALALHRSGDLASAASLYEEVLRRDPSKADGLYLFGCLAYQTGNNQAAKDLLQRAVTAAPDQAEYHLAHGLVQAAVNDYRRAIGSFLEVLKLAKGHERVLPHLADAWYRFGCDENSRGEFVSARDCFARALELLPNWLEARHNLGRALYELGLVSEAFAQFKACAETNLPGSEQSRAMMAVIVPGVPDMDNAGILETRKAWVERDLERSSARTPVPRRHSPLRVGYVSSFFQRDNWMKPVWGLINAHNRDDLQIYLLSDCAAAAIEHGYEAQAEDRYFDTSGLSNNELAALIRREEIDVLVDLNGYSNMRRLPLFMCKAAPVVIGWFNMYATTALPGFDYLIGDSSVVPIEEEQFYSEKILRVSGSYLTFDVNYPVPDVVSRPNDGGFMFGSLASQYKITDEVVEVWCRILRASPDSSLLVKNKQMASAGGRDFFDRRFEKHGISKGRLRLEGPEPHFDFLRAYERMDVALDTFPYNGGTTTTEAIWQGVPVVAFAGDRWASRTSASILRAAGLGEFVSNDLDGYVELAVELAAGREHLAELRQQMRARLAGSAVCDTASFARQMERLYQQCAM